VLIVAGLANPQFLVEIEAVAVEKAWPQRVDVDFGGLSVPFIARQDLITAKRSAGQPQDLLDIELLSLDDFLIASMRLPDLSIFLNLPAESGISLFNEPLSRRRLTI